MSGSKRWLDEHFRDQYVKKSKQEGYPSRAAYKLLEIQEKDQLIKPGMLVLDLGAAPGGWSLVASDLVGPKGAVIAVDLLPLQMAIPRVSFIQGDFTEQCVYDQILAKIKDFSQNAKVDLVISDMAPNLSGMKSVDQPKALGLVELAFYCAKDTLKPGGSFLAKVFQGSGVDKLFKDLRSCFNSVKIRKPKSSRARSSEIYVLAKGYGKVCEE